MQTLAMPEHGAKKKNFSKQLHQKTFGLPKYFRFVIIVDSQIGIRTNATSTWMSNS
jgi:hypothetical protein